MTSRRALRVLLVDDDPEQVEMYALALEHVGFDVMRAYDGKSALLAADQHRPDMIVLDVRMPEMDGLEVCSRLKADPELAPIPVVLLTGLALGAAGVDVRKAGVAAYLLKPCLPNELVATLRALQASAGAGA